MDNLAQPEKRIMKLADLKPADYNPRKIEESARNGLKASLEKFGNVQPVVWNEQTGNIVGGHQRFDIMLELGQEETEVVVVNLDEENEKLLNLALNNPKIQGTWDYKKLQVVMEDLKVDKLPELAPMQFKELHFESNLVLKREERKARDQNAEINDKEEYIIVVTFETEEEQNQVFEKLREICSEGTKISLMT